MRARVIYRYVWFISVLVMFSMACGLVTQAGDLKTTADAMATQVQDGISLLGTGQALATDFSESGVKETVQAAATGISESGVKETVQAVATGISESGAKQTVEALATQLAESGAEKTLQALATSIDENGYKETLQAKVTELPSLSGEKPQDIPLVADVEDVLASSDLVSYTSGLAFQLVLDFYQREMAVNGWVKVESESKIYENLATLNFLKGGRKATVVITALPVINRTTVVVTIQG